MSNTSRTLLSSRKGARSGADLKKKAAELAVGSHAPSRAEPQSAKVCTNLPAHFAFYGTIDHSNRGANKAGWGPEPRVDVLANRETRSLHPCRGQAPVLATRQTRNR